MAAASAAPKPPRIPKDYPLMGRVLAGRQSSSASVAIARAADVRSTVATRVAGGWGLAAVLAAAAATGGPMPVVLRLFVVPDGRRYPAAPELGELGATAKAALPQPLRLSVESGKSGGPGGDTSIDAGVACAAGGNVNLRFSWRQGTQQLTVEVPTAISRIALAQRVDTRLAVTALDKGTPGSNGKLRVDLTLSGQLGQKGTRLPITLAGFGRAAWDGEHKTATIRKDRQEITIDGPAGSSEVEVKELSDAVAAGQLQAAVSAWWEKKAEAAAAADGETEAAEEEEKEEAGQIAALLFEAQPEYATVTVAAPVGPLAPGTAADIRRQLWAWLAVSGQQLLPMLSTKASQAATMPQRVGHLEGTVEVVQVEVDGLAAHVDTRCSKLEGAMLGQQGVLEVLGQRVSALELSQHAKQAQQAQQPAELPDADMADAASHKRLSPDSGGWQEQQQQQQEQQPAGGPVDALRWAHMQYSIANVATTCFPSCSREQLLQAANSPAVQPAPQQHIPAPAGAAAAAGSGSVGAGAHQLRGGMMPTSPLHLPPQTLSNIVLRVLREQWAHGAAGWLAAGDVCSLVCQRCRRELASLLLLEDQPAQAQQNILRTITRLFIYLSKQPHSWIERKEQGDAAFYRARPAWPVSGAAAGAADFLDSWLA